MNTNNLNTALYEKMATEQEKYRDWLKSQPPEEILHHTYEYTVREDIVMAMEELELTDAQAQALLESPSPLADVYRYFEKLETGYMDVIRDSIENRADDVCKAQEELRTAPLYPHSAAYASEHGEMAQYNRSYQANSACKEAIEQTISAHYAENRLDTEAAVKDVLEKFGTERVQFILANTIQHKNHDGRISQDNKACFSARRVYSAFGSLMRISNIASPFSTSAKVASKPPSGSGVVIMREVFSRRNSSLLLPTNPSIDSRRDFGRFLPKRFIISSPRGVITIICILNVGTDAMQPFASKSIMCSHTSK